MNAELTQRKFYLLLLTWGLFLVLFLWSLGSILGPIVLFFVLIYLLSPFYGSPLYGKIATTLGLLTFLWLIWSAGFILTPFVLAMVLAYILNPLVNRLQKDGLGRTVATATVMVTLLLALVIAVLVLGPLFSAQVANFVSKLPEFLQGAVAWLQGMLEKIRHIPLPGLRRVELGEALNIDRNSVGEFLSAQQEAIRRYLVSGVIGVGKGLGVVLTVLSYLLLTPILTFFLLRDFNKIIAGVARLVPPHRRPKAFAFVREFDVLLGRYIRSQLVVAVLVGVIIGVGFWIAGFPYALLLGVVAGVFNLVPYLGFVITVIPAVLIALTSGNAALGLLKVGLVFGAEQALENFLSPRIVGQSVGLHPVWVMLSIVIFAFFFGFIGLLIAVPAAVGIKLMLGNLMGTYESSAYYLGPEAEAAAQGHVPAVLAGKGSA